MSVLVVRDDVEFDESVIVDPIEEIIFLVTANRKTSVQKMRSLCGQHFVDLHIHYLIPSPPVIPKELLLGFGHIYSDEVMIYGDHDTMPDQ